MASTSKDFEYTSPSLSEGRRCGDLNKRKRKKKSYTQMYNVNWEQLPEFKGWLQASKSGSTFAHCKCCNKDFVCGKSEIEKHGKRKRHTIKVKNLSTQPKLTQALTNRTKTAEINKSTKLSAFVVEHNLSFNIMEHLSELLRNTFLDSEIAKDFKSNRTKTLAIVNNVITNHSLHSITNLLNTQKFTLIVDESTDKSTIRHLALVVRTFTENNVHDLFRG